MADVDVAALLASAEEDASIERRAALCRTLAATFRETGRLLGRRLFARSRSCYAVVAIRLRQRRHCRPGYGHPNYRRTHGWSRLLAGAIEHPWGRGADPSTRRDRIPQLGVCREPRPSTGVASVDTRRKVEVLAAARLTSSFGWAIPFVRLCESLRARWTSDANSDTGAARSRWG